GYYGSRVFAIEKTARVTLSGLTVRDGNGTASGNSIFHAYDGEGGGILNLGTLTVSGCVISGNTVSPRFASLYGGGIYNAGTLTISNSTISSNTFNPFTGTDYGGGIYNAGTLTASNCTISNHLADEAGGIYNAGTATVSKCTLSGNDAVFEG